MAKKFSKFIRPDSVDGGRISERDLQVLETVLRYRFSPVSELLRLCGGNHTTTKKRPTWLWRKGLISRFAFVEPKRLNHSEIHYFIDNRAVLDLLVEYGRLAEIDPQWRKGCGKIARPDTRPPGSTPPQHSFVPPPPAHDFAPALHARNVLLWLGR
ncbi:MAG: hypothetical protein HY820_35700 [Acidobacteria bacterium]|nr:hypothetical protein [Acidobacteriota bacterium]